MNTGAEDAAPAGHRLTADVGPTIIFVFTRFLVHAPIYSYCEAQS